MCTDVRLQTTHGPFAVFERTADSVGLAIKQSMIHTYNTKSKSSISATFSRDVSFHVGIDRNLRVVAAVVDVLTHQS